VLNPARSSALGRSLLGGPLGRLLGGFLDRTPLLGAGPLARFSASSSPARCRLTDSGLVPLRSVAFGPPSCGRRARTGPSLTWNRLAETGSSPLGEWGRRLPPTPLGLGVEAASASSMRHVKTGSRARASEVAALRKVMPRSGPFWACLRAPSRGPSRPPRQRQQRSASSSVTESSDMCEQAGRPGLGGRSLLGALLLRLDLDGLLSRLRLRSVAVAVVLSSAGSTAAGCRAMPAARHRSGSPR